MRRLTLLSALALAWAAPAFSQTRPNVVLVVMDDVGYGDYGSYGAPDVRTPNTIELIEDELGSGRRPRRSIERVETVPP